MSSLLDFFESHFGKHANAADIADHFRQDIADIAANLGIDWNEVEQKAVYGHSDAIIPENTKCRYALNTKDHGKLKVWTRTERHESGIEYPFITFSSVKYGNGFWSGWQSLYELYQKENDLPVSNKQLEWQKKREAQRQQREVEQAIRIEEEKQATKKAKAEHERYQQMFEQAAADDGQLDYFKRKQISSIVKHITVKRCSDSLGEFSAIALHDINGKYKGLQRLYKDKKLQTVAFESGQFNGAHCTIGEFEDGDTVLLAEGFATGATLHMSTDLPVIVCISADNLIKVAQDYKRKRPALNIVVCTDNDINKNGNTGIRNGLYLAKEMGLKVVYPSFNSIDPTTKPTDFNDVHVFHKKGLKEVARQFKSRANRLRPEKNWFEYTIQRLSHASKELAQKMAIDAINAGLRLSPVRYSVKEVCSRVFQALPANSKIDRTKLKSQVKWLAKLKIKQAQEPRSFSTDKLAQANVNYIKIKPEVVDGREELPSNIMDIIEPLKGVVIIRAPMATGKTDKIIGKVFSGQQKALYLAHRVSLVGDASSRLKATNYQEVIPDMVQHLSRAAICINSIVNPKYTPFFKNLDAVCIDEAAQTLRHISSGESVDSPVRVLDALMDLIRDSKKVLMCDADANDALIDLAEAARPDQTIHVLEMKSKSNGLKILATDYNCAFKAVIDSVANGQKVLVPTDSASTVDAMATKLRAENENLRVLAIHADCKGESDVMRFLANANCEARNYDVVVYSPAISSGLSMKHNASESPYFDRIIGMFGGTVTPSDALQMLRRYRNAKEFTVGLKPRSLNQETDREHIWLGMIEADKLVTRVEETDDEIAIIRKKHIFDDVRVTTISNERKSRKDFANNMLLIALDDGWQVDNLDDDEADCQMGKEARSEASKAAKEAHVRAVCSESDIDEADARNLSRKEMKTRKESIQLERFQIRSHLCVEAPNDKDVVFWNDRGLGKIHSFELMQAEREQAEAYDQLERDNRVIMAIRKRKTAKFDALDRIFDTLRINRQTGAGSWSKVQAQELMDYFCAKENRIDLFNTLHLGVQISRFAKPKCAMTFVNNILAGLGLVTQSSRRTARGSKITLRSIKTESWGVMSSYIKLRADNGVHSLNLPDNDEVRQGCTTESAPEQEQSGQTSNQLCNSRDIKSVHINTTPPADIYTVSQACQLAYRAAERAGLAGVDWTVFLASESIQEVQRGNLSEDQLIQFFCQYADQQIYVEVVNNK